MPDSTTPVNSMTEAQLNAEMALVAAELQEDTATADTAARYYLINSALINLANARSAAVNAKP